MNLVNLENKTLQNNSTNKTKTKPTRNSILIKHNQTVKNYTRLVKYTLGLAAVTRLNILFQLDSLNKIDTTHTFH